MTLSLRSLVFLWLALLFYFSGVGMVEAGNTVSRNVGDQMPSISWNVQNAPNCITETSYPNPTVVGSISHFWLSLSPVAASSTNFGGRLINDVTPATNANGYDDYSFTCRFGPASDTSILRVCNNTTHEKNGAGGCQLKGSPSGSFSFVATPPCSIAMYSSSCTSNTSWTTSNVSSVSVENNGTPFSNATSSSGTPVTYAYGNNTLTIVNTANGQTVHSTSVNISCENPGADWNGTSCVPGDPKVENQSHSLVTQNSARLAANITSDGGVPLTARGFCWGLTTNPTSCTPAGGTAVGNYLQNITGLTPGTTYYYRGYATNQVGRTGYSFNGTFLTIPATPASPNAVPGSCGSGEITVSWPAVTGASRYEVYDNDLGVVVYGPGPALSFVHQSLAPASSHHYRLRAINATGNSPYSSATFAVAPSDCTYPDLVSSQPTFNTPTVRLGETINFSGIISNNGGAPAGDFQVSNFYIDNDNDDTNGHYVDVTSTDFSGNLAVGNQFTTTGSWTVPLNAPLGSTYRVIYEADPGSVTNPRGSVDEGGGPAEANWSPYSLNFSVVPPLPSRPGEPPSAPFMLNSPQAPCGGALRLTWGASTNGWADTYEYRLDSGAWVNVGNVTEVVVTNLVPGRDYEARVRARNVSGVSSEAGPLSAPASAICTILSASNCIIPLDQNTCPTTLNWDITGASNPQIVHQYRTPSPLLSTQATNTGMSITLYRSASFNNQSTGVNTIQARDGALVIQSVGPVAECIAGSFFLYATDRCASNPNISLSTVPASRWVRNGDTAQIITSISNAPYRLNCTVAPSTAVASGGTFTHNGPPANSTHTTVTQALSAATDFEVSCTPNGQTSPEFKSKIRVNVIPTVEER